MRVQPTALNGLALPLEDRAARFLPKLKLSRSLRSPWSRLNGLRNLDFSRLLQSAPSVWLFSRLHPAASRWLLGLAGTAYFAMDQAKRGRVLASLEAFLDTEAGQDHVMHLWRRVRAGIVDHYHEKLMMGFKPLDSLQELMAKRLKIEGKKILAEAHAQGRGVIMVTGHFGAVEFIPLSLAMQGYPLTTMVHCKSQGLRQALEYKASLFNTNLLDPKSESVLFRALRALKQGRVLITQCDELDCWRPYPNQMIDFLGLRSGLDRSLDLLARKSRSPVVFGLMHREPRRRYRLKLHQVAAPQTAARGQVARACLDLLSQNIMQEPQAWYEWAKLIRLINDVPPVADQHHKPVRPPSEAAT
jgi:KDO2-lipid IV(A) lauroyltransferase